MSITLYGPEGFHQPISSSTYSDNTPLLKIPNLAEVVKRATVMEVRGCDLSSFVTAMLLSNALRYQGAALHGLSLAYIPGARQDRVNYEGDLLPTLHFVADLLNSEGFDRVLTLDPHSRVSGELILNLEEFPLENVYSQIFEQRDYHNIIAPDKGAKQRANQAALTLNDTVFPVQAEKTRDVSTGRLSGFSVNVEEGKHYLVVDDICDGGGTFLGLAEKIHEQGATADLFVSHGIFSKGTVGLRYNYQGIYTTDSLPGSPSARGVTYLPVRNAMIQSLLEGN